MYVPIPRCRSCPKRISALWPHYIALTQAENKRDDITINFMLANQYKELFSINEDTPYSEQLILVRNTPLSKEIEDAKDEIITTAQYSHDIVCQALGITRSCCMVSLCDTAVAPIYSADRPPGLKIIVDSGLRRRIITREDGASAYKHSNYTIAHEHSLRLLFAKDVPRYSTGLGDEALSETQREQIMNTIDELPDDL